MNSFKRLALYGAKNKGGAGLSTAMIAIATVLRATARDAFDVVAIDADGFNRTLTQRLGQRGPGGVLIAEQDASLGVAKADLFERDGAAPIFEAIASDARVVIVDTPAGGLKQSRAFNENLGGEDLIQHCVDSNRTPIVMVPFGPSMASIRGVAEALATFGKDAHVVALQSMVGVNEKDYRLWNTDAFNDQYGRQVGGRTRKALEEAGGRVINAPALAAGTNSVAEALTLTYGEAAAYSGANWLNYDALAVRSWLKAWMAELHKISDLLGLDDVEWRAF